MRDEIIREFGTRVAILAAPRPGWVRMLGQGSVDGHPWSVDAHYYEGRIPQATVRTIRDLPASVQVRPGDDMTGPLAEFLSMVASATVQLEPDVLPPILGFLDELSTVEESSGTLVIDGVRVAADSIEAMGSFALRARLDGTSVILCGESELRGELSAGLAWHS
ncbi:hypothetical protein P3T37_002046 [Kitasatospora sp. MAA4]|uniref:hypothetical protein n=1 Tax=Kitasatospora sp. MAA4 TaxID=3035093 RepID=UPI0024747705|nr:hypothetical protein [Kitasatospora sp. MAA4]MDH6132660.1 hypothetical protein [Kitasatospora sp. MAA4]